MMLVDSCILIDISRQKAEALDLLIGRDVIPAISALTAMEVRFGVKSKAERELFDRLFTEWTIIPVDLVIAEQASELLRRYKPSHGMDTVDALIAATAQIHGLELITLNLKHFPMFPDLKRPY
ncbi:PIN domain-containing protein [Rhizobium sp.]